MFISRPPCCYSAVFLRWPCCITGRGGPETGTELFQLPGMPLSPTAATKTGRALGLACNNDPVANLAPALTPTIGVGAAV